MSGKKGIGRPPGARSCRSWDAEAFDVRRTSLGVTQADLMFKTGLSRTTLQNALKGAAKPATIKKLKAALRALAAEKKNLHMFEAHEYGATDA